MKLYAATTVQFRTMRRCTAILENLLGNTSRRLDAMLTGSRDD